MDRDAILDIVVREDRMQVTGTFYPAIQDGRILTLDYAQSVLENAGVVSGIDESALNEAIFACNTDHRAIENVPLAYGTPPVPERPAYWNLRPLKSSEATAAADSEQRIDHKSRTHIDVVHAGDVIARLIEKQEGVTGSDVLGNEIPFPTETVPTIEPGENVTTDGENAVADLGGKIVMTQNTFSVIDRLEVTGDVGYATGSIEFPGEVVVRGEIKEGFHIWAGKSVAADRTVDVSEIYCKGGFQSTGGIIGRGKALLRAAGPVSVRFAANCFVESKASIYVIQYVYHARVASLGLFTMEKSGRIIGGVVTAQDGVRCYQIGNATGVTTSIRVGTDFIVERKLRLSREKHQRVSMKLQRLTAKLGDDPTDRQLEIVRKLEEARNTYVQALGALTRELDRNESARVIVTGDVFPGAQIQICRAHYSVTEKLHEVAFSLSKESGRVVVTPLKELDEDGDATPQEGDVSDTSSSDR